MKIDSYSVQMNAQYYNLQLSSTQTNIAETTKDFKKDDSISIADIKLDSAKLDSNNELHIELSKAILQNINSTSREIHHDRVEISSTSIESQGLHFSVEAKVIANGREIDISMDLNLSRSFMQTTNTTLDILGSSLKDPLIIALDGNMPTLSSTKFAFDIDSDGTSDQISLLQSGSAFLALDKNNNGKIDNGKELFGTKSGDGFADLRKYDDDNNGWIDANDKIFDKLRIWVKTDTKDELLALGEVGIGAIFLGNSKTPFSLKSDSNELLGEMRKSGMFLFENGKAGIISHIDMAVESKTTVENLKSLQKTLSNNEGGKVYSSNQTMLELIGDEKEDDYITEIQKKIKILQAKLARADENEKANIQGQIEALQLQIMSFLKA